MVLNDMTLNAKSNKAEHVLINGEKSREADFNTNKSVKICTKVLGSNSESKIQKSDDGIKSNHQVLISNQMSTDQMLSAAKQSTTKHESPSLCQRRENSIKMLKIPSNNVQKLEVLGDGIDEFKTRDAKVAQAVQFSPNTTKITSIASTPSISEPNTTKITSIASTPSISEPNDSISVVSVCNEDDTKEETKRLLGVEDETRPHSGLSRSEGSSPMFFFGNHHPLTVNRSANGLLLPPTPMITFNMDSTSAPPSPNETALLAAAVRKWRLSVGGGDRYRDATAQRALMVTSSGSLLTMNQSSRNDLHGSSLSIHYPDNSKFTQ